MRGNFYEWGLSVKCYGVAGIYFHGHKPDFFFVGMYFPPKIIFRENLWNLQTREENPFLQMLLVSIISFRRFQFQIFKIVSVNIKNNSYFQSEIMYAVVSNRIFQTLPLIPSRDLALKRTIDSLRGEVNVLKF